MPVIEGIVKEVLNKTEWVAIVTSGEKSHLVGTWGDYIRELDIGEDKIVIPAGHYEKTEENLRINNKLQLLIASESAGDLPPNSVPLNMLVFQVLEPVR